ncbi:MAG: hypothetical protein LBI64_01640, partial [Coriobacteriales bacterium]|nr:hypothetical protein [Coriobacteriales bacterium]
MRMERFNGRAWLAELGYPNIEENPMGEKIEQWWAWYTATAPFYGSDTTINGRHFKVKRISIRPAKMVCEDWASLLFNERTEIGLEGSSEQEGASLQAANDWLEGWLADHDFMRVASRTTERAFALGTAGWALSVDGLNVDGTRSDGAEIIPERYDARQIIPLAYTGERCTECLFTSKVLIAGKRYNQLVVHRLTPDGSYEICTAHFNDAGKRVVFDNFVERFDTRQTTPTFALIRPGIDNCHLEYHPFGVSVFDQALGAVEMCDMAVDNLNRDLYLGQKMMFIPSAMLEKDARGNTVVPRAADQQLFAAFEDAGYIDGRAQGPYEYNPDLRV